jgi:hypothetical protein
VKMKTLSKIMKNRKSASVIALVLISALAMSFVIPTVQAQTWSIYISASSFNYRIRCEVRLDNVRQSSSFSGIMLGVKAPSDANWTYLGPFSTTNGRYDYTYNQLFEIGVYEFQYVVPPQGDLPTNPDTTDGKWYSDVATLTVNSISPSIYIAVTTSTGLIRGEMRINNIQVPQAFDNITLRVKNPGDTDWTILGPFSTTNGRVDYTYAGFKTAGVYNFGTYEFQYVMPPQGLFPTNPDTTDGYWYSNVVQQELAGSVYIALSSFSRTASTGVIRGEMRVNDVREQRAFTNVELTVHAPGAGWTSVGLFNTTNGRIDVTYSFATMGAYEFQYIVPAQSTFPTNPDSTDGKWYSDVLEVNWNWEIYISVPTSTAYPNVAISPVRMEARFCSTLQSISLSDVVLNVKNPSGTTAPYGGPYSTTNGRVDVSFTTVANGTYEFQYVVPPQGDLPTNPDTTDGKWYSDVATKDVVKVYYRPYVFIGAMPNPSGVGQEVLLHIGASAALQNENQGWEGITVDVFAPSGKYEELGPKKTDSTGGTGLVFVPDEVGNYILRTHFPEQQNNDDHRGNNAGLGGGSYPIGTFMREEYSMNLTLVITEEPRQYYPGFAEPTEYWTRPIDAQIREWHSIAGSSFEPEYQDAPESAHVLYAKRLALEGTIGGTVDTREAYSSRVIIAGILMYSTDPMANVSQYYLPQQTIAVDVRTGEELYRLNDTQIDWGQLYYHDSINRHAAYAYAWTIDEATRQATAYDPWDGNILYRINDFPEGPLSFGSIGEMLVYQVDFNERYMYVWNSSWQYMQGQTGMSEAWNVRGSTQNSLPLFGNRRGWQLNITLPEGLTGEIKEVVWSERVVGVDIQGDESRSWAFSLEPGKEGTLLWDTTVKFALPNVDPETVEGPMYIQGPLEDHVHLRYQESTGKYWAFSLKTGELLWSSEDFDATANGENALNLKQRDEKIAYGMLYTAGSGGSVYAYDLHNGLNWTYNAWANASEVVEGSFYWSGIALISDGKLYVAIGEPAQNAPFMCLDAMTGDVIWRTDGMFRQTWGGPNVIIGDSVIVTLDTYDMHVYAIGKGPSTTTVSAPSINVPFNATVTIKGTVMDVSPGTTDSGLGTYRNTVNKGTWDSAMQLRFPNGVPAVSDESMSDWMKYVYKNLPYPADVKGVEVVINVLDSNNNCYEVGRTVTDANGAFACDFVPPISGHYDVYAMFEGSNSYFGSSAETTIFVDQEIPAPALPTPTPVSIADTYFISAVTGIIVAIALIGAVLAVLILKKR